MLPLLVSPLYQLAGEMQRVGDMVRCLLQSEECLTLLQAF